ncbi:MAG: TetR/AcrR family transcriptional regulator [Clostridia bacterium]|nr:TetR/AcrR family transcriptional regulator [Clostridia bacterium]
MTQYKKDEIKQKIDNAAIQIFLREGYINAKMSEIAKNAKISVGNIYRYYSNKDELFYSIMPEGFVNEFKAKLFMKLTVARDKGLEGHKTDTAYLEATEQFIRFLAKHRHQFIILVEHGKETKYENFKDDLVDFLIETVKRNYMNSDEGQYFLVHDLVPILRVLFENLINIYSGTMRQNSSVEKITNDLRIINKYHLSGMIEVLRPWITP